MTEVEFTTETLIKRIQKLGAGGYFFGHQEKVISKHLFDLSQEGYLSVRYISEEMRPNEYYWDRRKTRFGSKTVAVYKMVSGEEKIKKIL